MGKRQSVRAMGDARNRMRISVQKELARTLEKIRRFDLPFWKHLDAALSTGWDVTYEPKEPVDWTTS